MDALAAQVGKLAQLCDRLSQENAELKDQLQGLLAQPGAAAATVPAASEAANVAPLRTTGSGPRRLGRPVSRRTAGLAAGAAAAGVVGAFALAQIGSRPASAVDTHAATEDDVMADDEFHAHADAVAASSAIVNAVVAASGPAVIAANSSSGPGLQASSDSGRGGLFSGSAAQVQLAPGARSTHPTSGKRGDLYADSTGRLWFCKKTGSRATWHQIA